MEQTENLSTYLLSFFRYLRDKGFLIGTKEMSDALKSLEFVDISDRQQFRLALQIVLCSSRAEQELFDHAFIRFFLNNNEDTKTDDLLHFLSEERKTNEIENKVDRTVESNEQSSKNPMVSSREQNESSSEHSDVEQKKMTVWVPTNFGKKEDQEIQVRVTSHQFDEMMKAAKMFVQRINLKQSRRHKVKTTGSTFDVRRTMRQSIQLGGYPIKPVWTGRSKEKANYILLCDSSRSMATYAQPFLQFAYAMTKNAANVEVFLFSTKLRRVTDQFNRTKHDDYPILTMNGSEWGGGTCIGESLYSFVQQYGIHVKKNTVILIASDGLDAGKMDHLHTAMKEIYQRTSAVVWLNPLLNLKGYEPIAKGMQTALPFIDLFTEATSASGFHQLGHQIKIRR
ncbi:vWA domain-containing protein [Sporosarcina sp. CAU 1771]